MRVFLRSERRRTVFRRMDVNHGQILRPVVWCPGTMQGGGRGWDDGVGTEDMMGEIRESREKNSEGEVVYGRSRWERGDESMA